jgi:hypothetical protein
MCAREKDHLPDDREVEYSDEGQTAFEDPRGWALKWDGSALSEIEDQENEQPGAARLNSDKKLV